MSVRQTLTPVTSVPYVVIVKGRIAAHVKLGTRGMEKLALTLMSVPVVLTTATNLRHVPILLGRTAALVTAPIQEMEKRAGIPRQNVKTTKV